MPRASRAAAAAATPSPKDETSKDATTRRISRKRGRSDGSKQEEQDAKKTAVKTSSPPPLKKRASSASSAPPAPIVDTSEAQLAAAGHQGRIVSWNVNGLRAALKKGASTYLAEVAKQCDVICLQEVRTSPEDKETQDQLAKLLPKSWRVYWSCSTGKKGYAGTAVAVRGDYVPVAVATSLPAGKAAKLADANSEGRVVHVEFPGFHLINTYVPNSGMKLDRLPLRGDWDAEMLAWLQRLVDAGKPVIWTGDLNVAHQEIDLRNPAANRNKTPGFTDQERQGMTDVLAAGFIDQYRRLNPDGPPGYTYFSYRGNAKAKDTGWRLDYFITSPDVTPYVADVVVQRSVDGSDHVPVSLLLRTRDLFQSESTT